MTQDEFNPSGMTLEQRADFWRKRIEARDALIVAALAWTPEHIGGREAKLWAAKLRYLQACAADPVCTS